VEQQQQQQPTLSGALTLYVALDVITNMFTSFVLSRIC